MKYPLFISHIWRINGKHHDPQELKEPIKINSAEELEQKRTELKEKYNCLIYLSIHEKTVIVEL